MEIQRRDRWHSGPVRELVERRRCQCVDEARIGPASHQMTLAAQLDTLRRQQTSDRLIRRDRAASRPLLDAGAQEISAQFVTGSGAVNGVYGGNIDYLRNAVLPYEPSEVLCRTYGVGGRASTALPTPPWHPRTRARFLSPIMMFVPSSEGDPLLLYFGSLAGSRRIPLDGSREVDDHDQQGEKRAPDSRDSSSTRP
jgi:hypothetical protein